MIDYSKYNIGTANIAKNDEGLRSYMLSIYNYMSAALFITGLVAFFASSSDAFITALYSISADGRTQSPSLLYWVISLAPLAMVFALSANISNLKAKTAQMMFWLFAICMGLSLSSIFLVYTSESIARTFFIASSTFGLASIYGYTTKKDLTSMGSFLMMGVFGLIIASLVNMFLQSSALMFALSLAGVLIFTGLAAYDTQELKRMYSVHSNSSEENKSKISIMGALKLYLDFINIFIMMLRLFGDRR